MTSVRRSKNTRNALNRTQSGAPAARGGRILVVDDIGGNRDLLSRRLQRDGHQVVTAAAGLSALERLGEQEFDLVLLDVLMPDMNGFELILRL